MKKEELVRKGYDKITSKYHELRSIYSHKQELEYIITLLPKKAQILDVGCGAGVPIARYFVDRDFSVTGIDISEKMIELAKKNVPEAKFYHYDMNELVFPDNSFHCITATYSLFHVPKEKHFTILRNFNRMLTHGGILFFCVGKTGGDHIDEYLGAKLFWSNYPPEKTLSLVKEAEFEILFDEILDRGDELQYWIIARKK